MFPPLRRRCAREVSTSTATGSSSASPCATTRPMTSSVTWPPISKHPSRAWRSPVTGSRSCSVSTPTADAGARVEAASLTRPQRAAGTIYDLGYQRYAGHRLGRLNAIRTLFTFSLRTAYGLGRGDRSKLIPGGILLVVFLPAIIQVGVASATGRPEFINYAGHLQFTALLLALFAAAQGPEMIVTDRQHGVLSLYLSRPLTGTDYAFAKLAALVGAMLVLTLGPQLLLFLGKVFMVADPWTALKAEWRKLLPIAGGTFVTSVFMASIGLALASLA